MLLEGVKIVGTPVLLPDLARYSTGTHQELSELVERREAFELVAPTVWVPVPMPV